MIKKVKVYQKPDKSDAFTMVLTSPTNVSNTSGFAIDSIDGLGPVKADINTTDMVVDGNQFNTARIGERDITLELIFYSESGTGIEDVRQRSYSLFPTKKPIYLEIEADNRTVFTKGYVEHNDPDIFSDMCKTQVEIICPDPKMYDADGTEITQITAGTSTQIEYEGEVEVGGILTIAIANNISAPVADGEPAFTVSCANPDGDAQQFNIYTPIGGFAAGDVIVINSTPGNKECYYIDETEAQINAFNLISQNPDWIKIKPGVNTILITDPEGAIDTVDFENPVCYEGV